MTTMNAIEVVKIFKKFRIHYEKNPSIKEKLIYMRRAKWRDYIVLDDITFNIKKGETVALIGKNGSGKSTLLKIISKILYPDQGHININGKVSSLLELGAGFHPDFTGRENIYMNAAILGLSRKEINIQIEEIIDFSELNEYIDEPVRSYSSGMYMRLAFSIAVALDPEILLVDEVLAVGDVAFQAKGIARIRELQKNNKTIVMVTHDSSVVENYCHKVIWLNDSKIAMEGDPLYVVPKYIEHIFTTNQQRKPFDEFDQNNKSIEVNQNANNKIIYIKEIIANMKKEKMTIKCGDELEIIIGFISSINTDELIIGFEIESDGGQLIYKSDTQTDKMSIANLNVGYSRIKLKINKFNVLQGIYYINANLSSVNGVIYDIIKNGVEIEVYNQNYDTGIIRIDHAWEL